MKFRTLLGLMAVSYLLTPSFNAWSGGAHQTTIDGVPIRWDSHFTYNLDKGNLKSGITVFENASLQSMVQESLDKWVSNLPPGLLQVSVGSSLPLSADGVGDDVNGSNYFEYLNNDRALNPIIFDEDGSIIEAMLGTCASTSILAFAGIEKYDKGSGFITKGRAVFGGTCIANSLGDTQKVSGCSPCTQAVTETQLRAIMIHELGHLLGMDHAQVNPDSYDTCLISGTCPLAEGEEIPTMFPKLMPGAEMETLHADDIAYFRRLYDDPRIDNCAVSGKVFAKDGVQELRGIEVVARPIDSGLSKSEALSFISGAEAPRFKEFDGAQDNCKGECGDYLITGLVPGRSYDLCVQKIQSNFTGGSGIEPVDPPVQGFSDKCDENLVVTCNCPSGDNCPEFNGLNITVDIDLGLNASLNDNDPSASAGGCSLVKPRTNLWPALKKALVISSFIQ